MDELTIGEKVYLSTKRAAALTGYAKDYIGQLCREGRVEAKLVGRSWYVREGSLRGHRFGEEDVKAVATEEDKAARFMGVTYTPEPPPELPQIEKPTQQMLQEQVPEERLKGEVRIPISHLAATKRSGAMDVVSTSIRQAPARTVPALAPRRSRATAAKSYLVTKAILAAIALLTVSVAVLGSGSLGGQSVDMKENSFISFIQGVHTYDRNK